MIYTILRERLAGGMGAFAATSLATGAMTLLDNAATGLFDTEYIEHFAPYPQLVLLGAGHVSAAVCRVCSLLGFNITVVDDREQFACSQNFPLADKIYVSSFDDFISKHNGGEGIYYAVLTRGHLQDRLCLEHILKKPCAYVGMIGSKRKNAMVFNELLTCGYSEAAIGKVYAPIGIDINADTPAEIAVSIAAQLIKVRSEQSCGNAFDEDVLHSLCSGTALVMATVCSKSGSAPRGEGAKIALLKNGDITGTIGGGEGEARVIKLMQSHTAGTPAIIDIQMSNESAGTQGLICGGKIKVLISRV